MNTILSRFVTVGVLFLLIFLSGFWLTRNGKPVSAILLNVHKLIALGAFIFLIVIVRKASLLAPLQPVQLLFVVLAGLLFVATIVTGGLVSVDKEFPAFVRSIHHLAPYLTVLASAAALYLLLSSNPPVPLG